MLFIGPGCFSADSFLAFYDVSLGDSIKLWTSVVRIGWSTTLTFFILFVPTKMPNITSSPYGSPPGAGTNTAHHLFFVAEREVVNSLAILLAPASLTFTFWRSLSGIYLES